MPIRPFVPEWYSGMPLYKDKQSSESRDGARRHAQRRVRARYNVDITAEQVAEYSMQIHTETYDPGKMRFLKRISGQATIWAIEHNGKTLYAIYRKQQHRIVTFLPPDAEELK